MKEYTLLSYTYEEFLRNFSPKGQIDADNQIRDIFRDSFKAEWKNNNNMIIVVNFCILPDKTIYVNGLLNITPSLILKNVYEIYNVCVRREQRRKGVLKKMLDVLPKDEYYMLIVMFKNHIAYKSYIKYFFCDFVGLGFLSYNDTPGFVLGGSPNIQCSRNKKRLVNKLNNISKNIKGLNIKKILANFLENSEIPDNIDTNIANMMSKYKNFVIKNNQK
jgi:hypothetical protein